MDDVKKLAISCRRTAKVGPLARPYIWPGKPLAVVPKEVQLPPSCECLWLDIQPRESRMQGCTYAQGRQDHHNSRSRKPLQIGPASHLQQPLYSGKVGASLGGGQNAKVLSVHEVL